MSNFDILIGVGEASVNSALAGLYGNDKARQSLFKGTETKEIAGKGQVTLTYDAKAAPTVTLASPTQAEWDAAIKKDSKATLPTANCFQVHFSDISGSEAIDGGTPVNAEGKLDVYLTAAVSSGALTVTPVAVWMDTSSFSAFDQWFVTSVLVPAALEMAGSVLGSIQLPAMPSYDGVTFNDSDLTIASSQLITGATLTTNTTPLSFEGFSAPDKSYYALISPNVINSVAQAGTAPYVGKNFSGSKKEGNDLAWAKGSYSASLKSISATADASDPTNINLSVKADISVSGSAGGVGPALACPVGAALNAF